MSIKGKRTNKMMIIHTTTGYSLERHDDDLFVCVEAGGKNAVLRLMSDGSFTDPDIADIPARWAGQVVGK